jgi:PKD repeat protein
MKKGAFVIGLFVGIFLLGIFLTGVVSASFEVGDVSHDLGEIYGPQQPLNGWINISLEEEPIDSLVSAFDSEISLLDLLDLNSVTYSCSPVDCDEDFTYSTTGNGALTNSFSITQTQSKTIGIKLDGDITSVSSLKFDVSTNVGDSCIIPLEIDVFDDGDNEWESKIVSEDFGCSIVNPYGCWSNDDWTAGDTALLTSDSYCTTIKQVPIVGKYELGVELINRSAGSNPVKVDFSIEIGGDIVECDADISETSTIKCQTPQLESEDFGKISDATVCINAHSSSDDGEYEIKWETVNPCFGTRDFPIFINAAKFEAVDDFTFNQALIEDDFPDFGEDIYSWIDSKYNSVCDPCVIPIKFSGVSQDVQINNLELIYKKDISLPESKIWDVETSNLSVNSDFIKLSLDEANLLVPSEFGDEEIVLMLNGEEILTKDIEIRPVPSIVGIFPSEFSALVQTTFFALLDDEANLTYSWDFGDGKTGESDERSITHTYAETGTYTISVTASNRFGNSTKTATIIASAPKEAVNKTISDYRKNLVDLNSEINKLSGWIKTEINKVVSIEDLENELDVLDKRYVDAFTDSEYVKVMEDLLLLNIPSSIRTKNLGGPYDFFPDDTELDFETLETMGVGDIDSEREAYSSAVNNWIRENIRITFESQTYSIVDGNLEEEEILSYVKFVLEPSGTTEEFYFIVNGDPSKTVFNNEVNSRDIGEVAVGISFIDLSEKKTLELLYPGRVDITNVPVYISPEFQNLEIGVTPGPCNNNKVCDPGENYKNCREDCKPIGWTVFWLFILLLIAFIVYIVLQEWYKRHYESKLFPNKSQLFNLVNFMSISLNQGVKKGDIYSKLKDLGWSGEQLDYVWKKLHGKKTGMWEIPIFKWVENRKVKSEIAKRQGKTGTEGLRSK